MLSLWFAVGLLAKWIVVFFLTLGWLSRTRDYDAGRMARIAALSLVLGACMPIGSIVLADAWPALPIIPAQAWSVLSIDMASSPRLLVLLLMVYGTVVFVLLHGMFLRIFNALAIVEQAVAVPKIFTETLAELTSDQNCSIYPQLKIFSQEQSFNKRNPQGPFTVGVFTPVIILPYSAYFWSEATLRRVLAHELMHVIRRDWFWQSVLHVLTIFMWFLPSAWRIQKKFTWLIELHADDGVLAQGHHRSDYANDLMAIAKNMYVSGQSNIPCNKAQVEATHTVTALIDGTYCYERIAAVLDGSRLRTDKPYKKNKNLLLLAAVVVGMLLGGVQVTAIPLGSTAGHLNGARVEIPWLSPGNAQDEAALHNTEKSSAPVKPLIIVAAEAAHIRPVEEMVIIERLPRDIKATFNTALDNDMRALAKEAFKRISILPSVKVHGYLAVRAVMPRYPRQAHKKRIEGQVIVQFNVLPNGKASEVRIAMAQPKSIFDKAVLVAIEQSMFKPAIVGGQAITTRNVTQTFTFKLTEEAAKTLPSTIGKTIKTAQFK